MVAESKKHEKLSKLKEKQVEQPEPEDVKPTTTKPAEKSVQIKVSSEQEIVEEPKQSANFDEERYNEYMLSDKGPRKVIDYSQIPVDQDLNQDNSSFD